MLVSGFELFLDYFGVIYSTIIFWNRLLYCLKWQSLSLKNTAKSFNNIHLLVLFVYFVLQVCMDDNLYGKSNVDKQTLFTRFESETISATKNIGHEKLNPITCSKAYCSTYM